MLDFGDVKGFVNLDAEYVNFGGSSFNLTAFSDDPGEAIFEEALNENIEDQLKSAVNINLGTEFVYKKYRVRAGVGLLGDPSETSGEDSRRIFSGGLGYRDELFFIDASYQIRDTEESYVPYNLNNASRQQNVINESTVSKLTVTIGYKL